MSKPTVNCGFTISNRDVALGLATPADLVRQAQDAEASGAFAHVWVGDSIMVAPRLESVTLLASIAAKTSRIRIGVACMATLPSRQPLVFAYQWASLDLLSGGRSILIACLGQNAARPDLAAEEYANMGITSRDRAARLEENLTIIRRLWTEDRVTFEGRFHRLLNASVEPKPAVPPPVWLVATPPLSGGKAHLAERALRRVARYGDGWVTTAWSKEDLGEMYRRLRDYALAARFPTMRPCFSASTALTAAERAPRATCSAGICAPRAGRWSSAATRAARPWARRSAAFCLTARSR